MADVSPSTSVLEFPASPHSRRSVLRGIAASIAGASVTVAAVAGTTARKLTGGDDTELLDRCRVWHDRNRKLRRFEKELVRLADQAEARTPPKPQSLFEPIELEEHPLQRFLRRPDDGGTGPSGIIPADGSWARDRLEMWAKERPSGFPSPACQAHCRKLLALLDEYEATKKRIWSTHDRLEKRWQRDADDDWRSFLRIIHTKAETLQGLAAQFDIMGRYWYPMHSYSPKVDTAIAKMMRNVRRLIAAQAAEA